MSEVVLEEFGWTYFFLSIANSSTISPGSFISCYELIICYLFGFLVFSWGFHYMSPQLSYKEIFPSSFLLLFWFSDEA